MRGMEDFLIRFITTATWRSLENRDQMTTKQVKACQEFLVSMMWGSYERVSAMVS